MPYFHNGHNKPIVHYLVNDSINALADAVTLLTGELFATIGARVVGQRTYSSKNAFYIRIRNRPKVFIDGPLEYDLIFCHLLSVLSGELRKR